MLPGVVVPSSGLPDVKQGECCTVTVVSSRSVIKMVKKPEGTEFWFIFLQTGSSIAAHWQQTRSLTQHYVAENSNSVNSVKIWVTVPK